VVKWELTIPDWVPDSRLSLNGRRRLHPMQLAKLTAETKHIVSVFLMAQRPRPRQFVGQADVSLVLTYPTRRRRDPDGLAGLAKPILDSLVDLGILVDDDCEHITLSIGADVQKGVTATRIAVGERTKNPGTARTRAGDADTEWRLYDANPV
jgi:hypothetical protein